MSLSTKITMKQIQHPNASSLTLLILPGLVAVPMSSMPHINQKWVIVMGVASFVAYFSVFTYYCIKQKCYKQMVLYYLFYLIFICGLFAMKSIPQY